jgi:hypothetical protein
VSLPLFFTPVCESSDLTLGIDETVTTTMLSAAKFYRPFLLSLPPSLANPQASAC